MAEAALSCVSVILNKILPLAADEVSRVWGAKKDLEKLAKKVEMMEALIFDAKCKQPTSKAVQLWLKRLQSIARHAEIVLDDFGYEVLRQKVENRKRDKMANNIKNVSASLEEAYREANQIGLHPAQLPMTSADHKEDRLTVPFVDESEMVGREVEVSQVVSMLISSDYKKDLPVISIVGMGGQGKTTLAQLVLKNESVTKHFDKKIWVCVSDDFKVERLLNEMLQSLGEKNAETTNKEALVRKLQENLKGKSCLLVLDDIWNDDREKWDRMRICLLAIGGAPGSKILATTRSDEVASAMQTSGVHHLDILLDDHSWMLFEKLAFADGGARKTRDLVDIGRRILKKCGGVPLAIKVIGGLLYSKKDASEWLTIEKSEIWNESTNIANGVISILKLSYENLPSWSVKQCFASCSIFPKDTDMKKESLIQIWMAQGLINDAKGGGHLQMEDIGSDYFNILLRSSLLQAAPKYGIEYYRMHDLVHDLSLQVSNNCFLNTEDGMEVSHDDEVMHLTIINLSRGKVLKKIERIPPNLQTLYYLWGGGIMLKDILKRSRYLSVLKVDCYDVTHLPNAVGNMKHLRHLDISETGITALPDSITKLYNLMTLKIRYLEEIPKKFSNLINLRHIEFSKVLRGRSQCLFPGIGQLANLRTLPHFVVSQAKGCQLEELEHLRNLGGELEIFGLENVSSFESAAKAKLSEKSSIQSLEFSWNGTKEDCDDNNINGVMEGLQPHPDLKSLAIRGFEGSRYPSWMVAKDHLTVLRNLVHLTLGGLGKCEQVPPLGDLPCLESLKMISLHNVKRIGAEFYDGKPVTLFPKLSRFVLWGMGSLEEWSDAMSFPNLRDLDISGLPKLAVLPDMENLTSLKELRIWRCGSLACIRNLNSLTSLECLVLSISGCDKLNPSLNNNLEKFTSLEWLRVVSDDPGSWPSMVLHHLANLRELELGGFSDILDLDHFPWPHSITNLVSLETLRLRGWPKITSLPDQIQHLSTLTSLEIEEFEGLEVLPEWMGSLRNLRELVIRDCSNLRQLPSAEAIRHLTNLNKLYIDTCPLLAERCTKGSGAEWPKIAHIPLCIGSRL
ncbi:unnamed protein product [Coffea canephora]|uniref:Disease resistance protein RGA3 n=1 Tax=Coffea canephora TaxID=49390 RepID=A0A068V2D9_COFCA|nr:unnamed protein product [Coffea canephora]